MNKKQKLVSDKYNGPNHWLHDLKEEVNNNFPAVTLSRFNETKDINYE